MEIISFLRANASEENIITLLSALTLVVLLGRVIQSLLARRTRRRFEGSFHRYFPDVRLFSESGKWRVKGEKDRQTILQLLRERAREIAGILARLEQISKEGRPAYERILEERKDIFNRARDFAEAVGIPVFQGWDEYCGIESL